MFTSRLLFIPAACGYAFIMYKCWVLSDHWVRRGSGLVDIFVEFQTFYRKLRQLAAVRPLHVCSAEKIDRLFTGWLYSSCKMFQIFVDLIVYEGVTLSWFSPLISVMYTVALPFYFCASRVCNGIAFRRLYWLWLIATCTTSRFNFTVVLFFDESCCTMSVLKQWL